MAITITVEDGSEVQGANSYQSVVGARTYALNRGVVLSADDDVVAAQLLNAMDWLIRYTGKWKGQRTTLTQELDWPRTYVLVASGYYASDYMPTLLADAQSRLVMAQHSGIVLSPNQDVGLPIIREKIGPIDTTYAKPVEAGHMDWDTPQFPLVEALLSPLLEQGFSLTVRRV